MSIEEVTSEERKRLYRKTYYDKNQKKINKHHKEVRLALKIEVLTHYGKYGKLVCCWDNCNVTDIDMLSLDHIHNNGAKERSEMGPNSYQTVKRLGFPTGLQTLCHNHQWKKELVRRRNKETFERIALLREKGFIQ